MQTLVFAPSGRKKKRQYLVAFLLEVVNLFSRVAASRMKKSLGRLDLPRCLDWYILNHSGPCPCDCNPHGLFCAFSGRPTNARRWQPTWRSFDEVPLCRAAS
jgi:hypothetical protein